MDIKSSKPIGEIKKGDVITVDGMKLEVDAHLILIDHGETKEMAVELFDPKTDIDYQLRYFDDQAEKTLDFYELVKGVMYEKKEVKKISW